MKLQIRPTLAPFVDLPAAALADALGGPTLFDLRKAGQAPLFISVLVHGNEVSGWDAVRRLHRELAAASTLIFVGNVAAARAGVRVLPGRIDFNRVWEGGDSTEAGVAAEVTALAAAAKPRLAIDIHNNTGRNPPYAVVARSDRPTLTLARAFSRLALFATQPSGFQTRRFASFCSAVTIEVGTPDDPASTDRAVAFLARLLDEGAPTVEAKTLTLFETTARVTVSEDAVLVAEAQRFNFGPAPAGSLLARAGTLSAWNANGCEVGKRYLQRSAGETVLSRDTAIAMYTPDLAAARLDCLCYLLEPLPVHV